MNLAGKIHLDCCKSILEGMKCQYNKKGRFNLNHPLMDVASKMPLLISLLSSTKAEHNSRKMHEHPRSCRIR